VVDGLKVHLGSNEREKLAERGTDNAEAYALYLRAYEYHSRGTQEGFRHGLQLSTQALELDPDFPHALLLKAVSLLDLYWFYERKTDFLGDAVTLLMHSLQIKADYWSAYGPLSVAYRMMGRIEEAEEAAKQFVKHESDNAKAYYYLGLFYGNLERSVEAIEAYAKSLTLQPDDRGALLNIILRCEALDDTDKYLYWLNRALIPFETRLRLVPDDDSCRAVYANLLLRLGHTDRSKKALQPLVGKQGLDAATLYSMTCLYSLLGDNAEAITMLQRAIAAGYVGINSLRNDPDLKAIRELPEFIAIVSRLETRLQN
jgi:adenylate cyclase